MKNYYKILGIHQNSTKEEIKKAFRELALKYHPDKNSDQDIAEQFKEVNEAKQVLLDDLKKFQYDQTLIEVINRNKSRRYNRVRRKLFYKYGLAFEFARETVLSKFFLTSISIVTILLTIAFFTLPDNETGLDESLAIKPTGTANKNLAKVEAAILSPTTTEKKVVKVDSFIKKTSKKVNVEHSVEFISKAKKLKKKSGYKNEHKKAERHALVKKQSVKHHFEKAQKQLAVVVQVPVKNEEFVAPKQLTNQNMVDVLNKIKTEKEKLGINGNSVQIIKSYSSNVQNAFMLANFLKGYGYVIVGREKTTVNSSGIQVDVNNNCIRITVGKLE